MQINSVFVRYRDHDDPDTPSQRRFGLHTAGWVPYMWSHRVAVDGGQIEFEEIPNRWNVTPFWVFQVPEEVNSSHNDIDSRLWNTMMLDLMKLNEVFDPDLDLRLQAP